MNKSHFPGTARYEAPNFAFDEWVIDELANGRYDRLLELTSVNLDEVGESELLTWFTALGVIGKVPGTLLTYQEMSHHGHGVVQFLPDRPERQQWLGRGQVPLHGGHTFTSDDYIYYRFPEPETPPLNRFLHRIVSEDDFRERFVREREVTVREAGLTDQETDALLGTESFEILNELGAHPLLSLSARQVSETEHRRQTAAT